MISNYLPIHFKKIIPSRPWTYLVFLPPYFLLYLTRISISKKIRLLISHNLPIHFKQIIPSRLWTYLVFYPLIFCWFNSHIQLKGNTIINIAQLANSLQANNTLTSLNLSGIFTLLFFVIFNSHNSKKMRLWTKIQTVVYLK